MEIKYLPFGTKSQLEQQALEDKDVGEWQSFPKQTAATQLWPEKGAGPLAGDLALKLGFSGPHPGARLLVCFGPGLLPLHVTQGPAWSLREPSPHMFSKPLHGRSPAPSSLPSTWLPFNLPPPWPSMAVCNQLSSLPM